MKLCALIAVLIGCLSPLAARDITLAWDASPSSNIVGYAVFWGANTNGPQFRTNVGNVFQLKTSITNDTTFWAIAIDSTGLESDLSEPATAKLVLPPKLRKLTYTTTITVIQQ